MRSGSLGAVVAAAGHAYLNYRRYVIFCRGFLVSHDFSGKGPAYIDDPAIRPYIVSQRLCRDMQGGGEQIGIPFAGAGERAVNNCVYRFLCLLFMYVSIRRS